MDGTDVKQAAHRAGDHPALEAAARVGYAVSGLLHLLIGWLALQVAWSSSGQKADQSGALASLAGHGLGRMALWVAVVGFLGLGLWQVTDAIVGHPGGDADAWAGRGKAAAKAVLYLALAWTSFGFARGGSSSSSKQTSDFTASLMGKPGGRWLVAILGLVVIGVGGYHVYKGWKKTFLQDLEESPGPWATRAGMVGYIGKGVALVVVGLLFVTAAVKHSASEATGLDGALHTLREQPFGQLLLTAVALGFVAFGLYAFSRSRHAKV